MHDAAERCRRDPDERGRQRSRGDEQNSRRDGMFEICRASARARSPFRTRWWASVLASGYRRSADRLVNCGVQRRGASRYPTAPQGECTPKLGGIAWHGHLDVTDQIATRRDDVRRVSARARSHWRRIQWIRRRLASVARHTRRATLRAGGSACELRRLPARTDTLVHGPRCSTGRRRPVDGSARARRGRWCQRSRARVRDDRASRFN